MDERAAAALADHILAGAPFAPRDGITDLHAGYAAQNALAHALAERLDGGGGFKIAWNTPAQMEASGMREPAFGRVFRARIAPSGTVVEGAGLRSACVEPEIAAILRADPGPMPDRAALMEAIDKFVPALELLDRRDMPPPLDPPQVIAQNIFNAGVVLGFRGVPPEALPAQVSTTLDITGQDTLSGQPPQDPFDAVAWLSRMAHLMGAEPQAGDVLLLGSHTPIQPVEIGQEITATMAGLGDVTCRIEA